MHRDDRKTFDTLVVLVAWATLEGEKQPYLPGNKFDGKGHGAKDSGGKKSLGFCRLYTPPETVSGCC